MLLNYYAFKFHVLIQIIIFTLYILPIFCAHPYSKNSPIKSQHFLQNSSNLIKHYHNLSNTQNLIFPDTNLRGVHQISPRFHKKLYFPGLITISRFQTRLLLSCIFVSKDRFSLFHSHLLFLDNYMVFSEQKIMPKTEACEICGAAANCIGSAKYICKSCSTFYRR
jgi:hypothetical protein